MRALVVRRAIQYEMLQRTALVTFTRSASSCSVASRPVVRGRGTTSVEEGFRLADGTIFRRPLPPPAIELSSPKGTQLFAEALQQGTARCFFRLMEQLHTQNEPEYCGLATLVTVLNALNIDPHRRWKGNWRFYSEELLDCCEPLTTVKTKGIDFDKLASLARCNGLSVNAIRAESSALEEFRRAVLEASQAEDYTLALAYSRKILNQTGTGHYSPMGAYHAASDHLLILDCARFKYRPHWVPAPLMFEAMKVIDPDTSRSRGFMLMSPVHQVGPPPAAHVLALSQLPSETAARQLHWNLEGVAANSESAKTFLSRASDELEKVFRLELNGHGCNSPARRSRITEQLTFLPDWDENLEPERVVSRKALFLCLDHAYVVELLRGRPELRDEVIAWTRLPEKSGELAVELSFTRPHVQEVLMSGKVLPPTTTSTQQTVQTVETLGSLPDAVPIVQQHEQPHRQHQCEHC